MGTMLPRVYMLKLKSYDIKNFCDDIRSSSVLADYLFEPR